MPMIISRESEWGKELARWETPRTQFVTDSSGEVLRGIDGQPIRGMKCQGFEEYPKMLYKAHRLPSGQPSAGEVPPHPAYCASPNDYEQGLLFVDVFNRRCQRIVRDEAEERLARGQGWALTQQDALHLYEHEQQAIARAAAEAEFAAQKMSQKARQEWDSVQEATSEHVVDVAPVKLSPPFAAPPSERSKHAVDPSLRSRKWNGSKKGYKAKAPMDPAPTEP